VPMQVDSTQEQYFMRQALAESQKALPNCLPNPPVGCVLVKNNQIIATGFTQKPGQYHAEAQAIAHYQKVAPGPMQNVSAFVTLEPCSFHGRTPPCAQAFIENQISTVYVAMRDPDPRNNGKGITMLKEAGIHVIEGVLREPVAEFLKPYLHQV